MVGHASYMGTVGVFEIAFVQLIPYNVGVGKRLDNGKRYQGHDDGMACYLAFALSL